MMNALKRRSVAYVRFASVYRDFQDIKDFSAEINSLNKEKPSSKKNQKNELRRSNAESYISS